MNYERERGCFSENYVEKFKKIQRLIILLWKLLWIWMYVKTALIVGEA